MCSYLALFDKKRDRLRERASAQVREPLRENVSRNGIQRKHKTAERNVTKTQDRVRVRKQIQVHKSYKQTGYDGRNRKTENKIKQKKSGLTNLILSKKCRVKYKTKAFF